MTLDAALLLQYAAAPRSTDTIGTKHARAPSLSIRDLVLCTRKLSLLYFYPSSSPCSPSYTSHSPSASTSLCPPPLLHSPFLFSFLCHLLSLFLHLLLFLLALFLSLSFSSLSSCPSLSLPSSSLAPVDAPTARARGQPRGPRACAPRDL